MEAPGNPIGALYVKLSLRVCFENEQVIISGGCPFCI